MISALAANMRRRSRTWSFALEDTLDFLCPPKQGWLDHEKQGEGEGRG
jgi:hypothetical protein